MPFVRARSGDWAAHKLRTEMQFPFNRTWLFASKVAICASTDKVDGVLARYSTTTRLGGLLDNLADKYWFLKITKQLVENNELNEQNYKVPLVRDLITTVARPVAHYYNINADSGISGKIKMGLQTGAVVAACSPLAYEHPEFVRKMYDLALGASVVSGAETIMGYGQEILRQYEKDSGHGLFLNNVLKIVIDPIS